MRKYLTIWFAITMSYAGAYGIPLIAAFILFAQGVEAKDVGGILFYSITSIILLFLLGRLNHILKKMKMGGTKLFIKLSIALVITFFGYQILLYVDTNTELLAQQLLAVVGGLLVSFPFKIWAIRIDKDYIERIGVFG